MKIKVLWILAAWMFFLNPAKAQNKYPSLIEDYSQPLGPAIYKLLTGTFPRHSKEFYHYLDNETRKKDLYSIDSLRVEEIIHFFKTQPEFLADHPKTELRFETPKLEQLYYHYWGMHYLDQKKYKMVQWNFEQVSKKEGPVPHDVDSTLMFLAKYLQKYGDTKEHPMFPHFNGAFGYYLRDSLKWNPNVPGDKYNFAIRALGEYLAFNPEGSAEVFECMGDLLFIFPDKFFSRWYSSLAYLRASRFYPAKSKGREEFETKIKYALESDRLRPTHFNRARFLDFLLKYDTLQAKFKIQLSEIHSKEKALIAKGETNKIPPIWADYPGDYALNNFYTYKEFGFLPVNLNDDLIIYLAEQREIEAERMKPVEPNGDPMNRDLKRQGMKKNVYFNMYALFVIAIILVCFYIFIKQVRTIDKKIHGDPGK